MITGSGIYSIRNITTGRTYVGSTRKLDKRHEQHVAALSAGRHGSTDLQADWTQLGPDCFAFAVLEVMSSDDDGVLALAEQKWIDGLTASGTELYCRAFAGRPVTSFRHPLTRLHRRRLRALLTQQELADKAGISRAAISAIEALKTEPQFSTIKKLAAALDCDPFDLTEPEQ